MCGIAGFWDPDHHLAAGTAVPVVRGMADCLAHRGPDDAGTWVEEEVGLALGHRRLSIVDLSASGHQPMVSSGGKTVLSFNGEIYNYRELREILAATGRTFLGDSDTEVLLAAIEEWGVQDAATRCTGMFAFAVWEADRRQLTLARDRFGEKPLFYGWSGGTLLFGSELKSLRRHPAWVGEIDREALTLYLRFGCVPSPHSIYQGIRKLPPGCTLSIQDPTPGELPQPQAYWSLGRAAMDGREARVSDPVDATNELDRLLRDAVAQQMVADVPLGAFLSGGIDSSTVVALMQDQSSRAVKTFTIGFQEGAFDESEHARKVAEHLGTDHTSIYVTSEDALGVIPRLAAMYDEPFADSSQIPTYLLCALARKSVTVALSGDGGDELFGGYSRHQHGERLWRATGKAPSWARPFVSSGLRGISNAVARIASAGTAFEQWGPSTVGERLRKAGELVGDRDRERLYTTLISGWQWPAEIVIGGGEGAITDRLPCPVPPFSEVAEWMIYADASTYLSDDILVKLDRAAMSVSLETRVPILDHRVAELAWRLPLDMKIRAGKGKWLLRQVLHRYVPEALVERPKMGFMVPIAEWLRGPLRSWAEELLADPRLRAEGFFHPEPIRRKWREHLTGRYDWHYELWFVLMFQAWLEGERRAA